MSVDRGGSGGGPRGRWTATLTAPAASATAVVLAATGILTGHPATVLVAAPLALAALAAYGRRPSSEPIPETEADGTLDGASRALRYVLGIGFSAGDVLVHARVDALGERVDEVVVSAARARALTGSVPVLHSGPQEVVAVEARLIGPEAAWAGAPGPRRAWRTAIAPPVRPVRSLPLPRALRGSTGSHASRRVGEGGDFRDLHPFVPGDRLRRIDWKATARRGSPSADLVVRRTGSLQEAVVMIVLDPRFDVGARVSAWHSGRPLTRGVGSLDLAREAAASLASAYLAAGDRVGFHDLVVRSRSIRPTGGPRAAARLETVVRSTTASDRAASEIAVPVIPSGALVCLLSPLLDDAPSRLAVTWRGSGHRVIVVDVLPVPEPERESDAAALARRLVLRERDDRLRRLAAAGVETVGWQDAPGRVSADVRLRELERGRGT